MCQEIEVSPVSTTIFRFFNCLHMERKTKEFNLHLNYALQYILQHWKIRTAQTNQMYWQCHAVNYCYPFIEKSGQSSLTQQSLSRSCCSALGGGTYLKVGIMSEDWNGPKKGKRSQGRKGTKTETLSDWKGENVLIILIGNHCNKSPWSEACLHFKHVHNLPQKQNSKSLQTNVQCGNEKWYQSVHLITLVQKSERFQRELLIN